MNFSEFLRLIPLKEKIEGELTLKISGQHKIWIFTDEKRQLKLVHGVYIKNGGV